MLKDEINTLIMESMKAHNKIRTETLRLIKSELVKAEKSKDYNETKVILKMIAAHKDSIDQFKGRQDLIDKEQAELDIIQEFAPKEVSAEEIKEYTLSIINNIPNISMKDMKQVLSTVQAKYPTADGKIVSDILKSYINK